MGFLLSWTWNPKSRHDFSALGNRVTKYREIVMTLTREFSDILDEYHGMMVERLAKYVYP